MRISSRVLGIVRAAMRAVIFVAWLGSIGLADAQASKADPREILLTWNHMVLQLTRHILAWAADDGGGAVVNMGFPPDYKLIPGPAHWVPTNAIVQQQTPLLPEWGNGRTFAMPAGTACAAPPALSYSEDPSSDFYKQA